MEPRTARTLRLNICFVESENCLCQEWFTVPFHKPSLIVFFVFYAHNLEFEKSGEVLSV